MIWLMGLLAVACGYPLVAGIVYRKLTESATSLPPISPEVEHRVGHGEFSTIPCKGWRERLSTFPLSRSFDKYACVACNLRAQHIALAVERAESARRAAWFWPVAWIPTAIMRLFQLGADIRTAAPTRPAPSPGPKKERVS